jgi:hypothetical protein
VSLRVPFFTVTELSGDNRLLNADEGTQGVGATVSLVVEGEVPAPWRHGVTTRGPLSPSVGLGRRGDGAGGEKGLWNSLVLTECVVSASGHP